MSNIEKLVLFLIVCCIAYLCWSIPHCVKMTEQIPQHGGLKAGLQLLWSGTSK